ncbi:MAG: PEP-CTERM sorting domain-containing protein [Phycisphaerales bacterium]|jgi:hypothetical protein|nr:PEP-CTERM sorting domain-containing protein [Phycisphaerales bacterium]
MLVSRQTRTAAYLALLITSQAHASVLVEYTFGVDAGTATNSPDTVATNLSSTPMVGKQGSTLAIVPHYFSTWAPGDMAMSMTNADGPANGGRLFEFTLQADPGFTFQVNDIVFSWGAWQTYGSSRYVSVWPNLDPGVGLHNSSGGDFQMTLGPAYSGWQMGNWNALAARTDLTSLMMRASLGTSGGPYITSMGYLRISGDVLPVPEPATLGLMLCGGAAALLRRR